MQPRLVQELTAEAVGTFALVFAGTGAVMADSVTGGAITHVGVSITFGAVVAAMIYAFGHVSGSQLNPAVTLAFWASGALPGRKVLPYVAAQLVGAIAASGVLYVAFGDVARMGATVPRGGLWAQSLALEVVLTFILMLVILGSGLDKRSPSGFAGVAIGLTVLLEAMCMGPITGASQ
jgi:glycerol uptake facilitator-like aquaporin